jgi:Ser-tRNA(Ala) deacylase AlaX
MILFLVGFVIHVITAEASDHDQTDSMRVGDRVSLHVDLLIDFHRRGRFRNLHSLHRTMYGALHSMLDTVAMSQNVFFSQEEAVDFKAFVICHIPMMR